GFSREEGAAAYDRGLTEYRRFLTAYRRLGDEVLRQVAADPERVYVALLGRPYNAFTRDANMGIPRKFASHGISILPFDLIYDPGDPIYPNMYWFYGQQNMKAVQRVKSIPNLYLTWISNFSCAPDSFMLHYVRWMMGQKPYLVLEIDSHSADAGIDTRVEAFLDIVESYRRAALPAQERPPVRRYDLIYKKQYADVLDRQTGERFDVRDPRVTLVFPSMGDLGVESLARASRKQGIRTLHLPVPSVQSTQLAREVASGKECIPALLVLGQILQFFREHPPNRAGEVWLVFVPSTLGPCRTGQYHVFYERLFEQLGWGNVVQLVAGSENSYREMGPSFSRDAWWSMVLADVFTDVRLGLRLLAADVPAALQLFARCWREVLSGLESGLPALERALARAGRQLAAVPRRRTLDELRKVLIVGEIYVRRDNFSVAEVSDYLVEQGIFPKVTDFTEWMHYTDYSRKLLMDEELKREGFWAAMRSGLLREQAIFYVEKTYKDLVQYWVTRHLSPTGLLPGAPHDMAEIVGTAK
ncbi:MAG: activase, partial [Deltaproteobacteria bacterium]|nr:activase [Deltaproteobacteria bacterium]